MIDNNLSKALSLLHNTREEYTKTDTVTTNDNNNEIPIPARVKELASTVPPLAFSNLSSFLDILSSCDVLSSILLHLLKDALRYMFSD